MTKTELVAKQYSRKNSAEDVSIKEAFEEGAADMLERVCEWLKMNTNWADEWDNVGRNIDFGKIDELRKDMEE